MNYLILQKETKKAIHEQGYLVTKKVMAADAPEYKTRILELKPSDILYFVSERGNLIGKGEVVEEFTTDIDFGKGNEGYARNIAVKINTTWEVKEEKILTYDFLFELNEFNNQPKLQYVNKLSAKELAIIEGE